MFRSAPRVIARAVPVPRATALPARRFVSTAPPAQKSRSWKSLVARLGLAGAVVYYYNTTDLFAEEPRQLAPALPTTETESETLPTIESIAAERAQRKAVQQQLERQRQKEEAAAAAAAAEQQQQQQQQPGADDDQEQHEGGIEGLQAEADQQGAFNPETGEINWDCPCLGGMATGPCGDEFKAAFSCFVFSKEEPKGMDCIDKFKDMQGCFRQYPEIYGSEIDTDDDDDDVTADAAAADVAVPAASNATDAPAPAPAATQQKNQSVVAPVGPHSPEKVAENRRDLGLVPDNYRPAAKKIQSQEPVSESESLVPKAAHDGR